MPAHFTGRLRRCHRAALFRAGPEGGVVALRARRLRVLVLALVSWWVAGGAMAAGVQRVSIAAASDLVYCVDDLSSAFSKRHPEVSLQFVNGSSGNFMAQIQRGAPFDVFLSADMNYARALVTNGLADAASLRPYAIGRLVLWTTRDDVSVEAGLNSLTNASIRRVAMANPDHAPYGRAAREALEFGGLWEKLGPRVVYGDNISHTAHFVQSGSAEAGFVALSLVSAPRLKHAGRWWLVPESGHRPLEQGMVLTNRGRTNDAARWFLDYLGSAEARTVLARYGFRAPSTRDGRP